MRLEFLHGRLNPPRLRDNLRQRERTNGRAGAFRRDRCDPQRLRARCFRRAREILRHDTDARRLHRSTRQQFGPVGHRRKPVREILDAGREQPDGVQRPRITLHADRRQ